jgi:hypothetical protein
VSTTHQTIPGAEVMIRDFRGLAPPSPGTK